MKVKLNTLDQHNIKEEDFFNEQLVALAPCPTQQERLPNTNSNVFAYEMIIKI